jgi:hypothetical protein
VICTFVGELLKDGAVPYQLDRCLLQLGHVLVPVTRQWVGLAVKSMPCDELQELPARLENKAQRKLERLPAGIDIACRYLAIKVMEFVMVTTYPIQ